MTRGRGVSSSSSLEWEVGIAELLTVAAAARQVMIQESLCILNGLR